MPPLDDYDKRLLQELQQNNQLTTAELSRSVNLSQSAVHRRIVRLRNEKYIEADVSIISPKATGLGIACVVDVVLHEGSSKAIDKFKAEMRHCSEVAQCYYVRGLMISY